ncbi:hypothetical protein [Halorhodospira neutriphila]|uniref:hypothetical protein n=1 Tax=Halorhodospira neutriphila TaxID=168379 RepID=UPI001908BAC2|nr:hypothetical protein [Halorhodospira neutriphila]
MASDSPQETNDPRPVSDHRVRAHYSREQVQQWRDAAGEHHQRWFEVMNNPYGKD